jgi:hypothetical protein
MECGHRWDKTEPVKGRYCKCPKCNIFLVKWDRRGRKDRHHELFMVLEHIKGFQVARYYNVTRYAKVLESASYVFSEVANQWLSPDGKMTSFARLVNGFYYTSSGFLTSSPFELRESEAHYYNCPIYPKKWIHPHVYRNGYDGESDHGFHIMYLSKILLAYPAAETMLKTGKWDLFDKFGRYEKQFKQYWKYMVIAWRHDFDIEKDIQFWFDHMDLLTYFKMDRHNPRYICSPDMEKEHVELSDRRTRIKLAQAAEKKRRDEEAFLREQKKKNEAYRKTFRKFFNFKLKLDKNTEIVVLKDVDDFIEEGRALHHCVGGYFGNHNDSLILSTRHKGKRIETIQFDLIDMEIKQARGACNQDSEYHHLVINTIMNNVQTIAKLKSA